IRTVRLVTRPARYLAGLVLPHQCVLCRCFADSTGLCAAYWSGLAPIGAPVCERCGLPLGHTLAEPICAACWMDPPPLAMMTDGEDGLVVPVPLHRQRYFRRRYNQSAELARRLCRITARGSLATDILVRHRATASQGGLSRRQRHRSIAGAFSVRQNGRTRLA
ncbi:MAG: double zinc ribbon domain-containing protein, partial [Pseudomonadota bacterium]|nr:double zinc ribbon domain-containing protein [Pseudomonadota bacterium]